MFDHIFSLKIGGQAGQGIKSAGLLISKLATRSGYQIYNYLEYPSLIRGGHNVLQINISSEAVTAPTQKTDLLIALNQDTINKHLTELLPGSAVIFDQGIKLKEELDSAVNFLPIPLLDLATTAGNRELLSNTVAIASAVALLNGNLNALKDLLAEEFADKSKSVIEMNQHAAQLGYDYVCNHFSDKCRPALLPKESSPALIINGSDALALGAIAAGLQFAAIYPMSPISNIITPLAKNQEQFGYIFKQPEDELAAINMAIGASFAGARSLTATSGGGFCLMTEGLGLAAMTETPLVIIVGMRPGPTTGLPTWSAQGDLQFVLHAHQDVSPRLVLAAADAQDAYNLVRESFNLADKYQLPVVLLLDKNICDHEQSFPVFNPTDYEIDRGQFTTSPVSDYHRFQPRQNGISPRTVPGSGNFFVANSDEHNSTGFSSEEITDRNEQMTKRMTKITTCAQLSMTPPQLFGPAEAKITLVSWGSTRGSILQSLKLLPNVNCLHFTWLNPFPTDAAAEMLSKSHYLIDVESNYDGQLASLIRQKTGIEIKDKLLKYDGRPIFPEEIVEKVNTLLINL